MVEWYVRTYVCENGVEDKTKFPLAIAEGEQVSTKRYRERALRKAEKNVTECKHELARILNNNFRARRDVHMTCEYSDGALRSITERAGTERDNVQLAAEREMKNFIRRVARECRKNGIELRYVFVTSDMDGKTKEAVRVHHHLIVNREAAEICREKWTAGETYARTLYGSGKGGHDLGDLAFYLVEQVRKIEGKHRYTPSRTLRKATPKPPVKARNPQSELAAPRGCEILWRAESRPGRPQHIRYYRPPDGEEAAG